MTAKQHVLSQAIENAQNKFSKLDHRIAAYLLARPEMVLIETSAEISRKLEISPMTLTRFFRKLGFENTAEMRASLRTEAYGIGGARIDHRFDAHAAKTQSSNQDMERATAVHALDAAFAIRALPEWDRVVNMVARYDSVYTTGFQTMRYLAEGFSTRLGFVRKRVALLNGEDGVYSAVFTDDAAKRVLIIVDTFRYGVQGPVLARLAKEQGVEVVVFCDEFCEWAAGLTDNVVIFPAETSFFMGLPIGISLGLNLLLQDVTTALGDKARKQIEALSDVQDAFGQHLE